jgi:hypothetical protein
MLKQSKKMWYAGVAVLLLFAPSAMAQIGSHSSLWRPAAAIAPATALYQQITIVDSQDGKKKKKKTSALPEGGSAAAYVFLAGCTCLVAIYAQSRKRASAQLSK